MANSTLVPSTFALSNDVAIEAVLSDIPLLCIGILGMGAFTVFLLLRRVNLFASYLFASSFLAFGAAVLDLSQILARGDVNTDKDGLATVSGFFNAREIFLALSVGFIYILFWTLVAQCPPEESSRLLVDIKGRHDARDPLHSASWRRWGFIGITLKWISLLASISIPLLQILWRIVISQRKYGNLYVAESTIETVVSAIFILKLLLNIYSSPLSSRWRSSGRYVTSIFSLIISAGLGVGNLIIFSFSETSLGRFLRAVEIYILILYSLVITFSTLPARHRHCTTKESDTKITPSRDMDYSTGFPMFLDRRISSISFMRGSQSDPAKKMGWDQNRELGLAPRIPSIALYPAVSVDQWEAESLHSSVSKNITSSSGGNSPYERGAYGAVNIDRPLTDLSLTYYTMNLRTPEPGEMQETMINGTETPDLALQQGERDERLDANATLSPSRPGSSVSSFEELLRRQSELDRSIAALRLLSPRLAFSKATPLAHQTNGSSDQFVPLPTTLSRNTLTASLVMSKPESASALSDFSLSIFPDPPAPSNVPLLSSGVPGETTSPDAALNDAPNNIHTGVLSVQVPIRRASSSLAQQVSISAIFDSEGTQYDVTSFVGGLAGPTRGVFPEGNFRDPSFLDEIDLEDETTPTITTSFSVPSRRLRPMILASTVTPRVSSDSPSEASASRAPDSNPLTVDSSVAPMPLRPFLLGTSSPLMPSSTMVPVGFRRIRAVSGRRPTISGPRPPTPDGRGDQAPGAFERPRPPPLILSNPNW